MIDAEKVLALFTDSLHKNEELVDNKPPADAILVEGIVHKIVFHPGRLESHRKEVGAILQELPPEFLKSKGGGWSFLEMCVDKDGNHWGEHFNMEQLVTMGVGLGVVRYCLDREYWPDLPGSMPYLVVDDDKINDKIAA